MPWYDLPEVPSTEGGIVGGGPGYTPPPGFDQAAWQSAYESAYAAGIAQAQAIAATAIAAPIPIGQGPAPPSLSTQLGEPPAAAPGFFGVVGGIGSLFGRGLKLTHRTATPLGNLLRRALYRLPDRVIQEIVRNTIGELKPRAQLKPGQKPPGSKIAEDIIRKAPRSYRGGAGLALLSALIPTGEPYFRWLLPQTYLPRFMNLAQLGRGTPTDYERATRLIGGPFAKNAEEAIRLEYGARYRGLKPGQLPPAIGYRSELTYMTQITGRLETDKERRARELADAGLDYLETFVPGLHIARPRAPSIQTGPIIGGMEPYKPFVGPEITPPLVVAPQFPQRKASRAQRLGMIGASLLGGAAINSVLNRQRAPSTLGSQTVTPPPIIPLIPAPQQQQGLTAFNVAPVGYGTSTGLCPPCGKRRGRARKCLERGSVAWRTGRYKGKAAGSKCIRFA